MSRIAGVININKQSAADIVRTLMPTLKSNEEWTHVFVDQIDATFLWAGWRSPVVSGNSKTISVVDGYFYNRAEIDHAIGETSGLNDAERLSLCFQKFGWTRALALINGDFAVALRDMQTNELWLARDRFGVKPLYYAETRNHFAFASRPRFFFGLPSFSKEVNHRFAAVFVGSHYRYIDNLPEESPYKYIRQLPPSHWLCFSDKRIKTGRYWDLIEEAEWPHSERDLAERYKSLLLDSVKIRKDTVDKDGTDSAFTLSGGLDSSSVLSCAVEITGKKQHAFSSVYRDKTYDESDEIQSMLSSKVEQWHPVEVDMPDVPSLVGEMVRVHDEPVATATWLSHYLLCEDVRDQGFGALYGGLGGDELNAGEYEYFFYYFADLEVQAKHLLEHEVNCWALHHDHPLYRKSLGVVNEAFVKSLSLNSPGRCLVDESRMTKYFDAVDPGYFNLKEFSPILDHCSQSFINIRTYQDLFRETAPCCLRAEDRHTTSYNLDHVDPFFDYRLAEFMFRVPGDLKIRDGITKRLLREAMKGVLPEETRTRIKKTGWNAPAHAWFAKGKTFEAISDLIESRPFNERGLYNVQRVRSLLKEHSERVESGKVAENHMMFFWQLLNAEMWLSSLN